jgi:FAD/FMN-containing dehydrogenases
MHCVFFLPTEAILFEPEMLKPYECDGLAAYQTLPWVVVLPATVEAVQSILRLCHKHGVPVVARGAGTGLSGGALPLENGVLISMVKFNNIRTIDGKNLVAVVEPGVTNLAISKKVVADGLYYAPDPSSQIACTIGGNVAENSGGVHCLKYGLTTHNILRLKVVTMTGELLVIGSHGFESEGYDLLAILTGSEGMLGIIVEVSVKLLPQAPSCEVMLAVFDLC